MRSLQRLPRIGVWRQVLWLFDVVWSVFTAHRCCFPDNTIAFHRFKQYRSLFNLTTSQKKSQMCKKPRGKFAYHSPTVYPQSSFHVVSLNQLNQPGSQVSRRRAPAPRVMGAQIMKIKRRSAPAVKTPPALTCRCKKPWKHNAAKGRLCNVMSYIYIYI